MTSLEHQGTGLAILGSGIFARTAHLPAIVALPPGYVVLRAVYSRSAKSANELAKETGNPEIDVYSDDSGDEKNLAALLARDDVHAVIVALPINKQPEVILAALKAGKHVLSEKPIGATTAIAQNLIETYKTTYKTGGPHWRIAENFEVEPAYLKARDAIRNGEIGDVAFFRLTNVVHIDEKNNPYYHTPWRTSPEYQGGFLLDGGVHSVAMLRTILPTKMVSLSSHASLTRDILAPHDTINAIVQLAPALNNTSKTTAHGIFELSFGAPSPGRSSDGQNGTVITGTKGWLRITGTRAPHSKHDSDFVPSIRVEIHNSSEKEPKVIMERSQGVEREVENFVNLVSGRGDSGFGTLEGALSDVAFIESALKSDGKPLPLL